MPHVNLKAGGYCGTGSVDVGGGTITTLTGQSECLAQCGDNTNCYFADWDQKDKKCTLFSTCFLTAHCDCDRKVSSAQVMTTKLRPNIFGTCSSASEILVQ